MTVETHGGLWAEISEPAFPECGQTWTSLKPTNTPSCSLFTVCFYWEVLLGEEKKKVVIFRPCSNLLAVTPIGSAYREAWESSLENVVASFEEKHGAERQKKQLSTIYFILSYKFILFLPLIHWDDIHKVPLAVFCPLYRHTRNVSTIGEGLSKINLYFLPSETKETKCNLTSWWLKVNLRVSMFTLGPLPSMILRCSLMLAPVLIIPHCYYFKVCVIWFSFSVSYWQSVNDNFVHFSVYTHLTISLLSLNFLQFIKMTYVSDTKITKCSKVKFYERKSKWIPV